MNIIFQGTGINSSSPPVETADAAKDTEMEPAPAEGPRPGPRSPWDTRHEFAHVDRALALIFPACFLSFNILYWVICIHFQDIFQSRDN